MSGGPAAGELAFLFKDRALDDATVGSILHSGDSFEVSMRLSLERLVYESTATGTTESLSNLVVILAESQRNNDRDGLTGVLAAHRNRYIQVIEGPPDALDALLRRLESDPRHRDLTLLDREPARERLFSHWCMANARITPIHGAALDSLVDEDALKARHVVAILLDALQKAEAEKAELNRSARRAG